MKTKFKSCLAAAVSAVITLCSMSVYVTSGADSADTQETYTLSYNLDYEGLTVEDPEIFAPVEVAAGKFSPIPDVELEIGDIYASGWTADDIYMFEGGDYFKMPDHDVVLHPVWMDPANTTMYTVSYNTEGDDYELLNNTFPSIKYLAGRPVTPTSTSIYRSGYTQLGWTYNGNRFTSSDKMVMPDNDVVFEPMWYKNYNVYYEAGDVDRINGSKMFVYQHCETIDFDLADSSRISRSGFTLSGWLCDYDGQIYAPISQFTMPSSDVHFTAVWTPKTYTVVFKSNNGANQTIKITGETDTVIIAPECTFTKTGYKFAGWQYGNDIYQAGDEFVIPGALPGLGIALNAVWVEDTGEEETCDSVTLAQARRQYLNGEITEEDLLNLSDFLLGK